MMLESCAHPVEQRRFDNNLRHQVRDEIIVNFTCGACNRQGYACLDVPGLLLMIQQATVVWCKENHGR